MQSRDRVDDEEWEQLCARDPRSGVCHRPGFVRALARADARWLEVRDDAGRLRAGLGMRVATRGPLSTYVSGVGGTYGGPVAPAVDAPAEHALAAAFSSLSGPWTMHRELVWRGHVPPRGDWRGLRELPTAVLRVDPGRDFDAFLADVFGRKGRKECNRSERRGLSVTRSRDPGLWSAFAPTIRARERHWGTQLPDGLAVDELLRGFEDVELFVVRQDDRVRGVHLALWFDDELFAWVGATERIDGANPATLLLREEARAAHERGRRRVNLGSSLGIEGVQRYKEMLGAEVDRRWIVRERPWWRGGAR